MIYHPGLPDSRALPLAAQGEKEKALSISRSIYIYAALKMREETLAGLEKAVNRSDRAFNYLYLNFPIFDFLREEPRFQRILEQLRGIYEERLRKCGDL